MLCTQTKYHYFSNMLQPQRRFIQLQCITTQILKQNRLLILFACTDASNHCNMVVIAILIWCLVSSLKLCKASKNSNQNIIEECIINFHAQGSTPHLVYFPKSYHSINIEISRRNKIIPLQITRMHRTMCHKWNITEWDPPHHYFCIKNKELQTFTTKFFHPYQRYRHSNEINHIFLLLWPQVYKTSGAKDVYWTLHYLAQFGRSLSREYIDRQFKFPSSYLGKLYFVFFDDLPYSPVDPLWEKNFPWEDYNHFDPYAQDEAINIPHQTFIYDSHRNTFYGLTSLNGKWKFQYDFIANGLPQITPMDNFLAQKIRVKHIVYLDEDTKSSKIFQLRKPSYLPYGQYPKPNKPASFILCSLFVARMPNTTIVEAQQTTYDIIDWRDIILIQFTSMPERIPGNQEMITPSYEYFPKGIGRLKGAIIYRDRVHYNFITCDGAQQQLSFDWILSPFKIYTWAVGFLTIFVLIVSLKVMMLRSNGRNIQGDWILIVFAVMLEQSRSVRFASEGKNAMRLALGAFLLTTIVITNAYRGIFVGELSAPKNVSGIRTLPELAKHNFTIFSVPKQMFVKFFLYRELDFFGKHYLLESDVVMNKKKQFENLAENETIKEIMSQNKLQAFFLAFEYSEQIRQLIEEGFNDQTVYEGYMVTKQLDVPIGYPKVKFQEKIAECKKTALIHRESELHQFFKPKQWGNMRPAKPLYSGERSAAPSKQLIVELFGGFVHIVEFLRAEVESLIESGIYDLWSRFLEDSTKNNLFRQHLNEAFNNKQSAMSLQSSNIAGVFWIYLYSCSLSLLCLCIEKIFSVVSFSSSKISILKV